MRINEPVPNQGRLNDVRRQSIADLTHLRRDSGAEIVITAALHAPADPEMSALKRITAWVGHAAWRRCVTTSDMDELSRPRDAD
jgi:hypothetical protein